MKSLPRLAPYMVLLLSWLLWPLISFALEYEHEADYIQDKFISRYHVDVINPSPENNPKGANSPGYRGIHQLVVYTASFGDTTKTEGLGVEAVILDGKIRQFNSSNSLIPGNGFVVSGSGHSGKWIKRIIKPGAEVKLDQETKEIIVKLTPDVYLFEVEELLDKARKTGQSNDLDYQRYLSEAETCYNSLKTMANGEITSSFVSFADKCKEQSTKAFYRSVSSIPAEFRGIWVRPVERTPDEIRQSVKNLKEIGIQHIFLETYYEGKTLYPSRIMADYGLPVQHAQFDGWDPLKIWIEVAREHGIKVHAWVQTFYAGNKKSTLEAYGPILQKYPEWRNIQRTAVRQPMPVSSVIEEGHYFVDPANPEVRLFLEKLILEIVTLYPVDGINLDYIRYPSSRPDSHPDYLASTWGYTAVARKAFEDFIIAEEKTAEVKIQNELKKSGKLFNKQRQLSKKSKSPVIKRDPVELTEKSTLWPRWVSWRKEQVSSFVHNISDKTRAVNKNLLVSVVIFPSSDTFNLVKLQDWPRWVNENWVQALTPIGLGSSSDEVYLTSRAIKRVTEDRVPVYAGIFGMYNRQGPVEFLSQIESVHRAGLSGVVLFERSKLEDDYREALIEGAFRK